MLKEFAPVILVVMIGVAGAFLFWMVRRERSRIRKQRARFFSSVYSLFDSYRVTQARADYPVLQGRYRDCTFHIDLCVDTLTFRKLPALWLRVSLVAPLRGQGTVDILVRAQNAEFFSPANDLPYRIQPPENWPKDALVKTDNINTVPSEAVMNRHIHYFSEPEAKEMLVTPKGVRLVYLIDQASRPEYLVFRKALFSQPELQAPLVKQLMDRAIALYDDLCLIPAKQE